MGDLPDIDATELSSEQRAIYDQIIARPVTGAVLSLCSCAMPSYSRVKDLYRLPE